MHRSRRRMSHRAVTRKFSGAVKTIMCGTQRFTPARRQWMPVLYGMLTPQQVTPGNRRKAWWLCDKGHAWRAVVNSRTGKQRCGCPICAGKTKRKTK